MMENITIAAIILALLSSESQKIKRNHPSENGEKLQKSTIISI